MTFREPSMRCEYMLLFLRVCELSEKNALCMFYLAPTRGATTFHVQNGQNVVAPLVGARIIHRPWLFLVMACILTQRIPPLPISEIFD